jgi:hypothetical protein
MCELDCRLDVVADLRPEPPNDGGCEPCDAGVDVRSGAMSIVPVIGVISSAAVIGSFDEFVSAGVGPPNRLPPKLAAAKGEKFAPAALPVSPPAPDEEVCA